MTKEQMLTIIEAIKTGHLDYITELLNDTVDINMRSGAAQYHLIHIASKEGKLEVVKLLLNKDPDLLNITDDLGQTPVLWAAARGHEDLVDYLIRMGADLTIATNKTDSKHHGYLPIHWAAERGYHAVIQCLINHGADINMRLGALQYHLIHIASKAGQLEVVKLLLNKDPDLLNIMDVLGQTPVLWAAASGHEDLVDYLATIGADLTIATNKTDSKLHGYLPIHWAAERGYHAVVQCLINHGADINMRFGAAQYHLIHIASKAGQLEVVKLLLNKDPDLLNITDDYGQTPVLWAAAYGQAHVVAYFISKHANLDSATNRSGHRDHGKTALTYAMEGKHYEAANLLILKITANKSKDTIPSFVQDGTQALEFMILEPALISIFLRDERIVRLINTTDCNITQQSIDWYKLSGRRPSWFVRINKDKETSSLFKPVKELGKGGYGIVRLFQTADGQEIGVKSLKDHVLNSSKHQRSSLAKKLKREAEFNKRAYPDDNFSETFEFNYRRSEQVIYTNRYIMPYVKGETARLLIPKITCPRQLAEITLQIAQELRRIHDIGIIHGDLNANNIMIDCCENKTFIIRLIDFGFSYYLTDNSACLWEPMSLGTTCMPPELCVGDDKAVTPHPNQDVYALGDSLNYVFHKHPSYQELIRLFPSINTFILAAQNINPVERPSLKSLCKQLSNELNPKAEREALTSDAIKTEHDEKISSSVLITNHFWAANSQKNVSSLNVSTKYNDEPTMIQNSCTIS